MRLYHFVTRWIALSGVMSLVLGLLVLAATPAVAQTTYTVDAGHITGSAAVDDPAPDGTCDADCSLREAVIAANANPGPDIITFAAAGTVSLDQLGAESDATNDLDLTDDVLVEGHPDGTTITTAEMGISADSRAFQADDVVVELRGLTVVDGENSGSGGGLFGINSTVTLTSVSMSGNLALNGGAVAVRSGSLTVSDSTFANNGSAFDGGAVRVSQADAATFNGSTFSDNTAGVSCCAQEFPQGRGGAIAFVYDGAGPAATVGSSTFTGNSAQDGEDFPGGDGGAIFSQSVPLQITDSVLDGNGGPLTSFGGGIYLQFMDALSTITNTTISDGTALLDGGGLYASFDVDFTVDASTISGNTATGSDGAGARGGGIFALAGSGEGGGDMVVQNSTVSGNTAPLGGGGIHIQNPLPVPAATATGFQQLPPGSLSLLHTTLVGNDGRAGLAVLSDTPVDLRSTLIAANIEVNCTSEADVISSSGYNLEDADDCGLDQPTDQTDTDPVIGVLADNGGQPQGADGLGVGFTHALLEGSPAIDTADPETCPDPIGVDERGVTRPQLDGCDIGAYEAENPVDVEVDKNVEPATIEVGETAVFTIEVTNVGTSPADTVVLTDVVPDSLTIDEVAPAGTCDPPAGQSLTCDLGGLAAGDSVSIAVTVTGTAEGSFVNTADVTVTDDENPDNDSSQATLVVGAPGCFEPGGSGDDGIDPGVNRIQGLNRIQTAIAVSQAVCEPGEAPAVVLTRSDLFPDAQAGTPLAIDRGAPLLLSAPEALSPDTETEIQRVLDPGGTVYLLGGTVALSEAVEARLETLGYATVRYGGANRFGTAAIIADEGLADPDTLLVADGGDFADSIVAGAAAAAVGDTDAVEAAVLLTSDVNIPPETKAYLDSRTGPEPALITIGANAAQAFPTVENISGPTRFETAVAVAERFFEDPVIVGVARSDEFADGLTGGALVGRPQLGPGPMVLVATDALPASVEAYLSANAASIDTAVIFGGTAAINADVENDIATALGF